MKTVRMKTPEGQVMSRIPEKDVAYHMKKGWVLVKEDQVKPEKTIKSTKVDLDLGINEENE